MVIAGVDFDEHVEAPSGIVTLRHLRNLLQFLHHHIKLFRVLQIKSHKSTRLITYLVGVDDKL